MRLLSPKGRKKSRIY